MPVFDSPSKPDSGRGTVCVFHPELRVEYQRGIYLYTKSLVGALKAATYKNILVSDFWGWNGESISAEDIFRMVESPTHQKSRSWQLIVQYIGHHFLHKKFGEIICAENECVRSDRVDFLRDVDGFLNFARFYDLCRMTEGKRFFPPVDVDFLNFWGIDLAVTAAPLPIRSKKGRVRIIQTVHDLIVLNTNVRGANVKKFRHRLDAAISHADLIMAVSEHTKQEILEIYPHIGNRVHVVHQPIPADQLVVSASKDREVRSKVLRKFGLSEKKFIFFVGAIEERKNIARLVRAYQASNASRDYPLVLAGAVDESYLNAESIAGYFQLGRFGYSSSESGIRYLGRISELEKLVLLREARLFAFPSLTEGFGIPVLEAQSMGCPVMTSNVSAIPEIVGSTAALINDPLNVDEIVSVLDATVADDYLCDQLRSDGLVNSQRFSKESFSHRLDDLIQSLN